MQLEHNIDEDALISKKIEFALHEESRKVLLAQPNMKRVQQP